MEKKKFNFADFLLAVVKGAGFIGFWFLLTQIIAFIVTLVITLSNFGSDPKAIEELVLRKSPEITMISNFLSLICFALFYKIRKIKFTERCLINHQPIGVYIRALALGFVGQYAIQLVLSLFMMLIPQSWIESLEQNNEAITGSSEVMVFILTVIAAPLLEEIMCRSLVLGSFRKAMPKWVAIVLSSLIFGALHANPIGIIYATAFGILLGWLTTKFESVVPAILCHMAFNLTSLSLSKGVTGFDSIMLLISVPALVWLIMNTAKYEPQSYTEEE